MAVEKCGLCARKCLVKREDDENSSGFCGLPAVPRVCRAALHFYEEPNISGSRGSGAIFFSGCILRCEFCQNYMISRASLGKRADEQTLCDLMKSLEEQGAHNINLVSPAPFANVIASALKTYKPSVPVIYNCTGYESVDSLKMLEGLIDVYLPDFKYADNTLALKYSKCANYTDSAIAAISEMYRQAGAVVHGADGMIQRGVMIRHLVLPGCVENSKRVLEVIKEKFSEEAFVSLMAQYTPNGTAVADELARTLTQEEYEEVCDYLISLGFENGFVQEPDSADNSYVPDWDLI